MAKALLVPLCVILLAAPVACRGEAMDNADLAFGFICRTISTQFVAVITPLYGAFVPESRIRFFDDKGEVCATGVVRSAYSDLAYVAVDNGSVEYLRKGFVASSGTTPTTSGAGPATIRISTRHASPVIRSTIGRPGPPSGIASGRGAWAATRAWRGNRPSAPGVTSEAPAGHLPA